MTIYEQLERDEGRRPRAYQDSRGFWTIGVGVNLHETPMPDPVIDAWLRAIVADRAQELERRLPWVTRLSEARYGALLNLAYNIGVPGLIDKNPKMLAALEAGDADTAANELLDGPYKEQVGPRAYRLARQIREDRWV